MKFDKGKLKELCAMDDTSLWCEVRKIAASYGLKLPEATPAHSEMERMRAAVNGGEKINFPEAMKIINEYRRGSTK